jgi:hypothetical protein
MTNQEEQNQILLKKAISTAYRRLHFSEREVLMSPVSISSGIICYNELLRPSVLPFRHSDSDGTPEVYPKMYKFLRLVFAGAVDVTEQHIRSVCFYAKLCQNHSQLYHDSYSPDGFCTWSRSLNSNFWQALNVLYSYLPHSAKLVLYGEGGREGEDDDETDEDS